jgi:hypothetical protein
MSSQAGIAQSLKTTRVRCVWRGSWFECRRSIQTGSGTQPAFTQWVTWTLSLLVERPGREADQCFTFSVDLNNMWSYTSTSRYACFEPCGQGILIRCYNTFVITVIVNRIWKIQRCNNPYWVADSGPPLLEIPHPLWKSIFLRRSQQLTTESCSVPAESCLYPQIPSLLCSHL